MNIKSLPTDIIEQIMVYLWGNKQIFKIKLNISNVLPKYKQHNLRVLEMCKIYGVELYIEDELYCPRCGEKTLFPFTRMICHECENLGFIPNN